MSQFAPLRILVVGEDPLARAGLARSLAADSRGEVVGDVDPGEDLGQAIHALVPNVMAWDLGWRPDGGIERLGEAAGFGVPILALVGDDAPAGEAWVAGARSVVPRDVDAPRLMTALAAVAQGLAVFDVALVARLSQPRIMPDEVLGDPLTPREMEVLRLMAEGLPNKAIGARLGVSEHTAKFHVNAILRKLGAQSRTEAAVKATRLGWILL